MSSLPTNTKLCVDKILLDAHVLGRVIKALYFALTKYEFDMQQRSNSKVVLIINHEKKYRKDHIELFRFLRDSLNAKSSVPVNYYELKRRFNWNVLKLIKALSSRRPFFDLVADQLQRTLENFGNMTFEKVVVFCDSVPLQNYICNYFNSKGIETYTLQHGFYISDENKAFELVYRASNAKNFFVWDDRTLKYMRKHPGAQSRNFIKAGPISKRLYGGDGVGQRSTSESVEQIAVYGCGKDQLEQNAYLVDLYKCLSKLHGKEVSFICHPYFGRFLRLQCSLRNRMLFAPNKFKKHAYDLHLVLNSGVWLELEERGERYSLLNEDFKNKVPVEETCRILIEDKHYSTQHELIPYMKDNAALEVIIAHILI